MSTMKLTGAVPMVSAMLITALYLIHIPMVSTVCSLADESV